GGVRFERLVQERGRVGDPRGERFAEAHELLRELLRVRARVAQQRGEIVTRQRAAAVLQKEQLLREKGVQALPERGAVEQIAHADADARGLVGVRWADAFARRTQTAALVLERSIQQLVDRQDDVRAVGDEHLRLDGGGAELVDLVEERGGVD